MKFLAEYERLETSELRVRLAAAAPVSELELVWCSLGPEHAADLREACCLAAEVVVLNHNPLQDLGVATLCAGEWPALRTLCLEHCELSEVCLEHITGSDFAARLEHLALGFNTLHSPAADSLIRCRSLRALHLNETEITDALVQTLARDDHRARLRVLNLEGNNLTSRSAQAIADSPFASELTTLLLNDNAIDDHGILALLRAFHAKNLRWLSLCGNVISDSGFIALANAPSLAGLQALEVDINEAGEAAQAAFRESPFLSVEVVQHAFDGTVPDAVELIGR